jgi:hypothetical protein
VKENIMYTGVSTGAVALAAALVGLLAAACSL